MNARTSIALELFRKHELARRKVERTQRELHAHVRHIPKSDMEEYIRISTEIERDVWKKEL